MKSKDIVEQLLKNQPKEPVSIQEQAQAFAPSNIALCKYWGKRDEQLNLPLTNSLSISLGKLGACTRISEMENDRPVVIPADAGIQSKITNNIQDSICVNGHELSAWQSLQENSFGQRLTKFLDLFRPRPSVRYRVETEVNIPIAAGLASSACGFAALVKALKKLYGWDLSAIELSVLARLGSGSACRSLWDGFVEWEKGERDDGLDSKATRMEAVWPELRVGLLIVDQKQKTISSRLAMQRTKETSIFYRQWPKKVDQDLKIIKDAIAAKDFIALGEAAESNAIAMHALMLTAKPAIQFSSPETLNLMQHVWKYRAEGLSVYFTQDAGPNLKLLFLEKDQNTIHELFPNVLVVDPWSEMCRHVERPQRWVGAGTGPYDGLDEDDGRGWSRGLPVTVKEL